MSVKQVFSPEELQDIMSRGGAVIQAAFAKPSRRENAERLLRIVFDAESTVQEARAAAVSLVEIVAPDILASSQGRLGSCQGYASEAAAARCECHERDGSYVCDHCYAQGFRGHMQRGQ